MQNRGIFLGLGSNQRGRWRNCAQVLYHAVRRLEQSGFALAAQSRIVASAPLGRGRQPPYCNMVIAVQCPLGPAALLRHLKRVEGEAGRRTGLRWAPRVLDIDILDYKGRILGHPALATRRGTLILPHPGIAERDFVLLPLLEVAPGWRHPILGVGARSLLSRRPRRARRIAIVETPAGG